MDRYPIKYFTSSLLLYRTQGVRFGHSLQRINYGNKKVFVELMLLQGVKQEKVWWSNDNGLPCGEVISDTSEYESSGIFRVGAKS